MGAASLPPFPVPWPCWAEVSVHEPVSVLASPVARRGSRWSVQRHTQDLGGFVLPSTG